MKAAGFILSVILFMNAGAFAQTDSGSVTGIVKEVKPHFAGQQTLVVDNVELVLISDPKDQSGNTFEINAKFKDILIKEGSVFVLNPKYKGKLIKFNYRLNGKGWKCISSAEECRMKKTKTKAASTK